MKKGIKILVVTVALAGVMAVPLAYGGGGHGQYGNQNGYCRFQDCDQQNPLGNQNHNRYGYGDMNGPKGDSHRYGHSEDSYRGAHRNGRRR